jgi:hypothetical protein
MQLELYCSNCHCHFTAPDTPAAEVLERITEEGPWCALGDGETFEDRLSTALHDEEPIHCPICGTDVTRNEETLGRLTQEMLAHW